MTGKQVLLYLVDGKPGGLRTAEIANWTGHVVAAPRLDVKRLMGRDEAMRTGVYLLLGDGEVGADGVMSKLYVGESDEIASRLRQHLDKKDWWDRVVIITSQAQAQQLTKSQVRYLESQLITRAKTTGRVAIDNGTDPGFARLSEAETSNMNFFLEQLHVLLPAIGVDAFRGRPTAQAGSAVQEPVPSSESPVFHLRHHKSGAHATAQFVDGEFLVLEGSTAVATVAQSDTHAKATAQAYRAIAATNQKLREEGVTVLDGALTRFAKDVPFSSPSTAGSVVLGRNCNGRTVWKTESGMTFGQWESGD